MRPALSLARGRAWLHLLRWVVAALVLALAAPAASAGARAGDVIVLVASPDCAKAAPAPRDEREEPTTTRAPQAARARLAMREVARRVRHTPDGVPLARRERLYLLDCALLR